MRVAVVGAGGIGGFIAAALARAGNDVSVVARGPHLAAIQREGLKVESDLGPLHVRVPAGDDVRTLGAFDALFLTFKSHQWPDLLEQLEPFAHTGTTLVTLQNGLPFWYVRTPSLASVDPGGRIAALFCDEQIVGGAVHVSGTIVRPGFVRQSGGMRYPLGAPNGGTNERVERIVAMMADAGLAPERDAQIRTTIWLKLVNNAGLNPVSALHRMRIREMLADSKTHAQVRALMEEALAIGRALGVVDAVDVDARIAYAARLSDVKTSMLQDLEAGRALELDPILGALLELSHRVHVSTPKLRQAYDQLRSIARG